MLACIITTIGLLVIGIPGMVWAGQLQYIYLCVLITPWFCKDPLNHQEPWCLRLHKIKASQNKLKYKNSGPWTDNLDFSPMHNLPFLWSCPIKCTLNEILIPMLWIGYNRKGVWRTGTRNWIFPNPILFFSPFRVQSIWNQNFNFLFGFGLNRNQKLDSPDLQPNSPEFIFPIYYFWHNVYI